MFNVCLVQVCCAASRTFVHESIHDKFVARCAELAKERQGLAGDPFDAKTIHTAQIDGEQFKKILNYIELGKKEGAQLVTGGQRIGEKGTQRIYLCKYLYPGSSSGSADTSRVAKLNGSMEK